MKAKALFILLSVSIFFSCDDPTDTDMSQISITQKNTINQEKYNQLKDAPKNEDSDPFELIDARRDGTKLLIDVSFSGGCAKHEFELVWPEIITMIYPPSFSVILIHNNGGDNCEAYLSKTLEFETEKNGIVNPKEFAIMDLTVVNGSNADESKKLN